MPEGNKFKIDSSGSIVHENSSADSSGSRIPREIDLFGFVVDLKVFIVILATVLFFFRFKGCKHAICFHRSQLALRSKFTASSGGIEESSSVNGSNFRAMSQWGLSFVFVCSI